LFADSTEAELRAFDRQAGEIWVERGTDLMREGARGVEFAVIADGRVQVARTGAVIADLGPGDFIGELALLDDRARTATVTTTARTRLLVLGPDEFASMMRDVPSVRAQVDDAAAVRREGVPVVPAPRVTPARMAPPPTARRRRLLGTWR
jgi:CRP/FNR family cyclic AMP-dependent transcriptional regulator